MANTLSHRLGRIYSAILALVIIKQREEKKDLFIKRIGDVGDLSPPETLHSQGAFCCLEIDWAGIKYIHQLNSAPRRNVSAKATLFQAGED